MERELGGILRVFKVQNRSGSCQRSELLRNLEGLKGYGGLSIKGVREKTFGMDKVSKV